MSKFDYFYQKRQRTDFTNTPSKFIYKNEKSFYFLTCLTKILELDSNGNGKTKRLFFRRKESL